MNVFVLHASRHTRSLSRDNLALQSTDCSCYVHLSIFPVPVVHGEQGILFFSGAWMMVARVMGLRRSGVLVELGIAY